MPPVGYCRCGCGRRTNIATKTDERLGNIKGQPLPYVRGHRMRVDLSAPHRYRPGETVKHRHTFWPWKLPLRWRDGMVRAYALVDEEDFERLGHHRWCMDSKGYVYRHPSPKTAIRLHREILGLKRGDPDLDHENGNKLDNRRSNLRPATDSENGQNRGLEGGTSRHRGVVFYKRTGKWMAQASLNGKHYHLGYFDDEDDAGRAAQAFHDEYMPYATDRSRTVG
jgi:hypothetical protein